MRGLDDVERSALHKVGFDGFILSDAEVTATRRLVARDLVVIGYEDDHRINADRTPLGDLALRVCAELEVPA